jgi:hypothetical protein
MKTLALSLILMTTLSLSSASAATVPDALKSLMAFSFKKIAQDPNEPQSTYAGKSVLVVLSQVLMGDNNVSSDCTVKSANIFQCQVTVAKLPSGTGSTNFAFDIIKYPNGIMGMNSDIMVSGN